MIQFQREDFLFRPCFIGAAAIIAATWVVFERKKKRDRRKEKGGEKRSVSTFRESLEELKHIYRRKKALALLSDVVTFRWSLSTYKKIISHDEKLTLFEDIIPREPLAFIAKTVKSDAWAKTYAKAIDPATSTPASLDHISWLSNGTDAWNTRVRIIDRAKTSIVALYAYVYLDTYGWKFCERLAEASRRGVAVSLLIDEFGAESFNFGGENPRHRCGSKVSSTEEESNGETTWGDMMRLLVDAGVRISYWSGEVGWSDEKALFPMKNHNKLLIVDSNHAIIGDRNIGAEYFRDWAGADILVSGKVASCLENVIEEQKRFERPLLLPSQSSSSSLQTRRPVEAFSCTNSSTDVAVGGCEGKDTGDGGSVLRVDRTMNVEIITHIPDPVGYDAILHRTLIAIDEAKTYVDVRSCYVVLCRPLQEALIRAIKRGVIVRVLTNSVRTNDLLFIHAAMCLSLVNIAHCGAKIYMTLKHMDHTKFILIDRRVISVGSWNVWLRTHFYEAETNLMIRDVALGERIGFEEFDRLVSNAALASGDIAMYTEEMLEKEARDVGKAVCPPDSFHSEFI